MYLQASSNTWTINGIIYNLHFVTGMSSQLSLITPTLLKISTYRHIVYTSYLLPFFLDTLAVQSFLHELAQIRSGARLMREDLGR